MNRHASVNRIYRLVWSQASGAWVPVAETARGRGKTRRTRSRSLAGPHALAAAISMTLASTAHAAPPPCVPPVCGATAATAHPLGGQVLSGNASITQSGNVTDIRQSSPNLSIDWLSFNIGSLATVDFTQPSASSVAVNRISGADGSEILGHLDANGRVYLINPNGIIFGPSAEVNVGGLVASTLNVSDSATSASTQSFAGNGTGSIVNQGTITAANGGYVALLGNQVSNQGVITARLGTVVLGAGSAVTLDFSGSRLVHLQVDQSTLNNLAANNQLIQADGGLVIMTAGARDALLKTVVNNTGVIEARTVENHDGTIELLGAMTAGTVKVGGTLDASAPDGGNGGFIETDAAKIEVANAAKVTTAAAKGLTGSWLVDPQDFTIAPSGGDISGATLSTELGSTSVTLLSSSGAKAGSGNINVDDAVSWSANTLTLTAANNINVNAVMTATGSASLALNPSTANGADAAVAGGTVVMGLTASGFTGMVNFTGTGTLSISGTPYTVITGLGAPNSATGTDLQGINGNLFGYYALGSNIDATATSTWNSGAGFTPIGNGSTRFAGTFNGLGHTISNLTVRSSGYGGLFGETGPASVIQNVGMIGGSVSGSIGTGGLVGFDYGSVSNSYVTGGVSGGGLGVGGLVGYNGGSVSNSYAAGGVSGASGSQAIGGLVGYNDGTVGNSYATGSVSGASGNGIGGLVGENSRTVSDSYATGSVSASGFDRVGGLVGVSYGTVSNSHATGSVSGASTGSTGGLVGSGAGDGVIIDSYATGNVSGTSSVGGLVGINYAAISNSYATGSVSGTGSYLGGLVGENRYGSIQSSYATGSILGGSYAGGLVGVNYATISDSYATGSASGLGRIGGLVGYNPGTVSNSFWNITTSGQTTSAGGIGMTTAQMQTQANFTSATTANGNVNPNWDFANTWVMYSGYTYPLLRPFMTPLTVTANNATITYDQQAYSGGNGVTYSTTPNNNLLGTISYGGTSQGAVNAGAYTITPVGLYSNQQGYIITVVNGALTINPLALTGASIAAASSTYGGPITPGALTFSNVLAGDVVSAAVNIMNPLYSTSNHLQAGSYAQAASSTLTGANAEDYSFNGYTTPTANYTVNPLELTGTAIAAGSSTYRSAVTPGTVRFGNVIAGDIVSSTAKIVSPTYSTSHNLAAGSYAQSASALSGADAGDYTFTAYTTPTANYTVNPLALTGAAIAAGSSTYGYAVTPGTVTFGNVVAGDQVGATASIVSPSYSTSHNLAAGSYAQTASPLSGADAGDYTFAGFTTPTDNYKVKPRALTVATEVANNKVYNGKTAATLSGGTLLGVVSGDTVTLGQSGIFASQNVGTGIAVTATDSIGGSAASDYTLTEPTGLKANITQLASVAWVGGTTGNWSAASNWAGGAIPDLSNVAQVTIPKGDTVTYDSGMAALGTTKLTALTDSGNLIMAAGTLDTGNLSTAGFTQKGGKIDVGGNLSIRSTVGSVTLGNITAGSLSIDSTAGAIKQAASTLLTVTGATTLVADNGVTGSRNMKYGITLANAANNFEGAVTSDGLNIILADGVGGVILGNTTATGTLKVTSLNGAILEAKGKSVDVEGATTLIADNGAGGAKDVKYAVALANDTNDLKGSVTADGSTVTLYDAIALTAILDSSGSSTLTSVGAMDVSGTVGTNLTTTTTGTKHSTTFGATTIGKTLVVKSTGAVTETSSNILKVAGEGTTTVHNSDVTVNGVKGAEIPAP